MPANRHYNPRYNAKLYIPKLTEEERRARATPLEADLLDHLAPEDLTLLETMWRPERSRSVSARDRCMGIPLARQGPEA